MGWSFRIARVAGIAIDVHFTFIFIVLLGAFQWGRQYGPSGAVFGAILILLLFVCVTLHELGHAFAALRFKIPVRQIVLLPLGGVALIEDSPEKPFQELIIAACGPLVNVLIAIVLWLVSGSSMQMLDGRNLFPINGELGLTSMVSWLIQANISLVIFNLLPAFPLDGGRIFRAFLAFFMSFPLATKIAVYVGQALAMLIAGIGLLTGNLLLILVAVFIFSGARQERRYVQMVENKLALQAQRVGELIGDHPPSLNISDRIGTAANYMLSSKQPALGVFYNSQLIGIVSREDVVRSLTNSSMERPVTDIMQERIIWVEADDQLEAVRQRMFEEAAQVVAVSRNRLLQGFVSREQINAVLAAQQQ